jgi:SAM-dependent methyltransferase
MHQSSYDFVQTFALKYVLPGRKVIDIGSRNVNGTFKPIFKKLNVEYTGVDIDLGENVDIVLTEEYNWEELQPESFDIVIAGSVIEHCEYPWLFFDEVNRILKPNGLICVTAPAVWEEHKYPVDCYRYYPDGLKALCKWAEFDCIETGLIKAYDNENLKDKDWYDCYCIGRKQ